MGALLPMGDAITFEIGLTYAVLAGAVALFVSERLRVDVVALGSLSVLLLGGVLEPDEALAGFGNPATVTVAAMFVLSAGLLRTGVGEIAGRALASVMEARPHLGLGVLMVSIGAASAFVNNTAAVAMMLPVVLSVAAKIGTSPSKLLMPLSFASMFGGVCTLIGTSTNLLVSEIARDHGASAFTMFEVAPLGIVFFAIGTVYMLTLGHRLLPERRTDDDLTATFDMDDYLIEISVGAGTDSAGVRLAEAAVVRDLDIDVIEIRRGDRRIALPGPRTRIEPDDVLRVRASLDSIRELERRDDVDLQPSVKWRDAELDTEEIVLVEVVLPPHSGLVGSTLLRSRFRNRFDATVLAIRRRGQVVHERLKHARLLPGDTLLLEVRRHHLAPLRASRDLVLVSEKQLVEFRRRKLTPAVAILAAVVLSAAFGLLPIVVSAMAGCVAMVITRCLTIDEAYRAVDWGIVCLLAGVIGLGRALERTGGAALLSDQVVTILAPLGAVAVLSGFYLLTSLLTEAMSNNATVVLLAPVAIATAETLGVDSRPFLMAVTFAASASFMTPVGYQTNTIIYGPGRYRFGDFVRVGLPLNLLFWVTATLLIPIIWPL